MTTVHKSYPIVQFKALPNEGAGTCEAVVSVIGNVDLQGDRVVSGAFDKSIEAWQKAGDPLPVLWSHNWGDPFAHIGYVLPEDMYEIKPGKSGSVPGGLYVKAHFDVDKPFAKQVYDLLAERRVKEWSFSYDIPAGGEQRAKDGANELVRVDVIEVGPTLKGANPATVTLGTKGAPVPLTASSDQDPDEEGRTKVRLSRAITAQLELELAKAEWSGDRAMGMCKNAADFRKIAFERADSSDPDTAAHWALPHHMGPNADANPAGVSAALGALNGARGGAPDLKSKDAAQSHLEAHQAAEQKAAGDPSALISWFNDGADGGIDWGSDGDYQQCVDIASNHMSEDDAHGFCQLRHMDATGMTTSEHAHEAGKAFDPSQHRGPNGEWATGGGGDGGNAPDAGSSAPGGSDRKHTAENDAQHPLGEGTLNDLRVALNRAGMPKQEILALVQKMRDDFHQTGKINIPKEADKVLPTDERAKLGEGIRSEAEKRGWDPKTGEWHPKKSWDGKAGRVIGSSAAAALKQKLSDAVDAFVTELNGGDGQKFSDDQPRDDHGRFAGDGGGGDSSGSGGSSGSDRLSAEEIAAAKPTPADEIKSGDRIVAPGARPAVVTDAVQNTVQGDQNVTTISYRYEQPKGGAREETGSTTYNNDVSTNQQPLVLPPKKNVVEGDKKDFALGYADGAARRPKTSDVLEYVRGYEEGQVDRETVESHELDEFKAMFSQLEIKSNA